MTTTVPLVAVAGSAAARGGDYVCFFFQGMSSSECASWVQAWGSIIAIVATAVLFFAQGRRERRTREDARKDALLSQAKFALQVLHSANREVISYEARFKHGLTLGKFVYDTDDLEEVIALLREAYLGRMFAEARTALIGVRQSLLFLERIVKKDVPGHTILNYAHKGEVAIRIARLRIDNARAEIRQLAPAAEPAADAIQQLKDQIAAGQSPFERTARASSASDDSDDSDDSAESSDSDDQVR